MQELKNWMLFLLCIHNIFTVFSLCKIIVFFSPIILKFYTFLNGVSFIIVFNGITLSLTENYSELTKPGLFMKGQIKYHQFL